LRREHEARKPSEAKKAGKKGEDECDDLQKILPANLVELLEDPDLIVVGCDSEGDEWVMRCCGLAMSTNLVDVMDLSKELIDWQEFAKVGGGRYGKTGIKITQVRLWSAYTKQGFADKILKEYGIKVPEPSRWRDPRKFFEWTMSLEHMMLYCVYDSVTPMALVWYYKHAHFNGVGKLGTALPAGS
ncbi:MAG: hypothetical protein AAFS07_19405, partial [Pseudomonadota bacterium]